MKFHSKKIRSLSKLSLLVAGALATANIYAFPDFEEAKSRADSGKADAQAIAATYYALGWQTEKNPEAAIQYAEQSSRSGNPLGKFRLGAMMRNGEGIPKDEPRGLSLQAEAVKIWSQDFDEEDPFSLTALGVALFQGKVLPQDKVMAAKYYKKAADLDFAPAQYNYAMCAKLGEGIPKDSSLSQKYLRKAAQNGYRLAQEALGMAADASPSEDQSDAPSISQTGSLGGTLNLAGAAPDAPASATGPVGGKLSLNTQTSNKESNLKKIVTSGLGDSPDAATKNALAQAIKEAVGAMVDSKVIIENEEVIQDRILTVSDGFVKEYTTLKKASRQSDGLYHVEIEAVVQMGQIAGALKAANIKIGKVGGDNVWAEASTKVTNVHDARTFLEEKMPEYLEKLVTIDFLDANGNPTKDINPIIRNENAVENKVTLGWVLGLKINKDYYKSILPYIKQCFSVISGSSPRKFSAKGSVEQAEKKIEWEPAPLGQLKQIRNVSDNIPIYKSVFNIEGLQDGYLLINSISRTGDYIEGEYFNLQKYQIDIDSPLVLRVHLKDKNDEIIATKEWAVLKDMDNSFYSLSPIMMSPVLASKLWGHKLEIQDKKFVDAVFEVPIELSKEIDSISCEIQPTMTKLTISEYQTGFPKKSRDGMIIPNPW